MIKVLTLIVLLIAVALQETRADDGTLISEKSLQTGGRQKRLLFYDEDGNLVKTYRNPYLQDLSFHPDKWPFYGNFINPFFSFLRASALTGSLAFTIPVSSEVIQRIQVDPIFQHKLFFIPKKEPTLPSPKLCNTFLNCWDGWAFEQECPEGLLFSNEGYCDYSENVDCMNRFTNARCNQDFETFRNKLNCNEFFVCVNRQPVKFKCPADLAYSQDLGVCNYSERVDCGGSPLITAVPLPVPSEQPPIPNLPGYVAPLPPKPAELQTLVMENSMYNSQSWSSTHVAMSRQDAIRQIQTTH
ncbi:hypothetical protein K1T71_003064 [Dendrolimus kikuchii]|uniref:Uncharacterized protein n=1 Tax=Dendrolimus kikuchii TaxID=765133 RepID=A0ACC1DAI3_9NEOP|nr:hypothetical protein K1T71_003064 [Dendrolimus kikuchii]